MMQPGPGGMPGGAPPMEPLSLGQNKGKKTNAIPKLIDDSIHPTLLKSIVNKSYQLFFITRSFCKKIMWFGSCFGLMFMFPMMIEYMSEQTRILAKLQMQMGDSMMGQPEPPQMRPF